MKKLSKKLKSFLVRIKENIFNLTWNWANIISLFSTAATFLALAFSIYQNNISDKRYFENEKDNNKELDRIRRKDSIQTKYQIDQTNALISELEEQKKVNRSNRQKDSLQLNLYNNQIGLLNKSVIAQTNELELKNQDLELQKTLHKPSFDVNIDFHRIYEVSSQLNIRPIIQVKNVGNSIAYDVNIDYLLVGMESETNKIINTFHSYEKVDINLNINDERIFHQALNFYLPLDFLFSESDITPQKSKGVFMNKYFIILRIKYKDKYNKSNIFYVINQIHHNIQVLGLSLNLQKRFLPITLRTTPFLFEDLPALRETFISHKLDYRKIYKIYKAKSLEKQIIIIK